MKILWFEVTSPSRYNSNKLPIAGWQDALENLVLTNNEIELYVSFESKGKLVEKKVDRVTYLPFNIEYSRSELKQNDWKYDIYEKKIVEASLEIVKKVQPDLIHVFGNEWPYGLIAENIEIPVVIHIQGSIIPYFNANYPPGYNYLTICKYQLLSLRKCFRMYKAYKRNQSRVAMEYRVWKAVHFYMGRTCWDKSLVKTLSPNSLYYHIDEALREQFMKTKRKWNFKKDGKIRLITTGMSTFWKGPDMLLKTAHILKVLGVDFEWNVIGLLHSDIKNIIEKKEGLEFSNNNVYILGIKQADELIDLLCQSTFYVHTAYIDNSPNSICEAQYLGLPVISTHVGGIETLLENGQNGILVPANDPWRMAYEIINLSQNDDLILEYSSRSMACARNRHNPQKILSDLIKSYKDIIYQYNADK